MIHLELEDIPCPYCKSDNFSRVAARFDGLNIVCCQECNLVYLNPRPRPKEIAKMYESDYYGGKNEKDVGYSGYVRSIRNITSFPPYGWELLLNETTLYNMRTLDIGCAFGQWVYWMSKEGANATGIDISSEGIAWGHSKLGLDLRNETLESIDEPEGSFDVITMIDLIEHIVDLDRFMARLKLLLKPGGLVFVQTPNFGCYTTWGDKCRYLRYSLEHLLYFDTKTLDNLFAKYNMFPLHETCVLETIPCDIDSYAKARKANKSPLKNLVRRLPFFDLLYSVRHKMLNICNAYNYDDTKQKGATIIGCYRNTPKNTDR